jgi:hypothetical protein
VNLAVWATRVPLVSNNREGMEERTRDVVEGDEALAVALGTTMQRIRVVPCSVTELNSASICRHRCPFLQNVFGGQRQSSHPSPNKKKKRWQQIPTAEPEVPAVPPRRHLPSARKSRLHPSLRHSPAEPSCLLPDGSTKCPTISGFIKSCTRFWI